MSMMEITRNGRIKISFVLTPTEAAALFQSLEKAGMTGSKVKMPPINPTPNPDDKPSDNGPADPTG